MPKINERKTEQRAKRIADFAEKLFFFCLIGILSCAGASGQALPDPKLTPGSLNPDVTQETISKTICVSGWTKTIRPSVGYTNKLKKKQMKQYGDVVAQKPKLAKTKPDLSQCIEHSNDSRCYEEDHFIPLEVGGNPLDPNNLWPQRYYPKPGAKDKDSVENEVHKRVCSGELLLAQGQSLIRYDWLLEYNRLQNAK